MGSPVGLIPEPMLVAPTSLSIPSSPSLCLCCVSPVFSLCFLPLVSLSHSQARISKCWRLPRPCVASFLGLQSCLFPSLLSLQSCLFHVGLYQCWRLPHPRLRSRPCLCSSCYWPRTFPGKQVQCMRNFVLVTQSPQSPVLLVPCGLESMLASPTSSSPSSSLSLLFLFLA